MFKKLKKGFTLVELVIVIAVVAILAAASVGAYFGITDSANNSRLEQESKQVYTAVQTVALAPNDHSSLSSSGLVITNLQKFETELEKNLGKDVYLTNVVDEKVSTGPTICFSAETYVKATLGGSTVYKSFQYHNAEVSGKKYIANIITGEGHVAKVQSTTTPETPTGPAVANKIVLTEYNVSLGHNSDGYKVEATVYDQYNQPMDVLGEWVLVGPNNVVAYSPTQGLNRLVIWGQTSGVVTFKFVYENIESDLLTITVNTSNREVSIDFSQQGYENEQVINTVYLGKDKNITVTFNKGTNNLNPKYFDVGASVRVYGGGYFIVSAMEGTIIQVSFTFGSGDKSNTLTADNGSLTSETWTGSTDTVKFTVDGTSGQRRIKAINVVYIPE